jgi:hypothetical protein
MRKAADGELDTGEQRGAGQLPGEVAGVGAQPHPPGRPGLGRERRQGPVQQLGAVSVTAAIPDTGVNDGSGAPTRTRRRNRRISRTPPT